jgi:hypothetical protein
MTRETNNKKTAEQPLANAYFGTFAFLQSDRQPQQNAKEPKLSSRTSNANLILKGSVLTY